MKKNEQLSKPFFAQFLEQQNTSSDAHGITRPIKDIVNETHKYPSDSDEEGEPA